MGKKKILIVDDEENFSHFIQLRLEHTNQYEVKTLPDAKDILSFVHVFRPDLILLDLLMPEIGGIEVCEMLNNDPIGMNIPIIVVSALDKEVDRIKAYKLGAVDYFVKPIEAGKLIIAIERAISSRTKTN